MAHLQTYFKKSYIVTIDNNFIRLKLAEEFKQGKATILDVIQKQHQHLTYTKLVIKDGPLHSSRYIVHHPVAA